jgi:hypothetical protein
MEKQRIINPELEGVSLRVLWTIIGSTILVCATVLGVYYDFRNTYALDRKQTEMELKIINMRLDKLEAK